LATELVELHDKAEDMSDLQQCLEECLRQYEDAMEQLDDATAAVDSKRYREAAQWVSVAQGDVRLCQVGCKSVPEYKNMLTRQNSNVGRLCSITAAILRSLVRKN
jgi:pectinesterase inhibitor-like protein